MRLAGLEPNEPLDEDKIVFAMRSFLKSKGRHPHQLDMGKDGMPSMLIVKRCFGCWKEANYAAGLHKFYPKNKCIAVDDHECASLHERYIDELLYCNGIEHRRDVPYPYDEELNACITTPLSCDFVIGNVFVEYFGFMRSADYKKRRENKKALCVKLNIRLIEIFEKDLPNIQEILKNAI